MRCSTCGFPLSPTRINCPRCGTAYGSGANATPEALSAQPGFFPHAGGGVPSQGTQEYSGMPDHSSMSWDPALHSSPSHSYAQTYGEADPATIEQLPFPEIAQPFS